MTYLRSFALTIVLLACTPLLQAQSESANGLTNLTFTTIDVPGAKYTGATGINSFGDIVGNYGQDTDGDSHGFLYSDGGFT